VRSRQGSFPPFSVRFGAGGTALACLADAIVGEAAEFATVVDGRLKRELEATDGILSAITAERLRAEPPEALADEFSRFLLAFADAYAAGCRARKVPAIFLLEDAQNADPLALRTVSSVFGRLAETKDVRIILTMPKAAPLDAWQGPSLRYVEVGEARRAKRKHLRRG
jgi:hypothetical protein